MEIIEKNKKRKIQRRTLSPTQYIAVGFILMILLGSLLLMLPISSRTGQWTDPLSAAFTATSASCVTGLVVFDTYTHWSLFGQLVILIMIQIGGLGFITMGVFFAIHMRHKIGLRMRGRMQESVSALQLSGSAKLAEFIVKGTLIIEGIGAVLLSIRFVPMLGLVDGIYYGIFHSISAFCNAGFDLMGRYEPFSSLVIFRDDPLVNITVCLLVLVGGLGFLVWNDLYTNHLHFRRYQLHTKLVLVGTLFFTVGGAVLYFIVEQGGTLSGVSLSGQLCASLFGAVTPRTAGFNTTDTGALTHAGQLLTLILMLVGGNSGSTAGGVKVTTIMVMYLFVMASMRRSTQVEVFGRRLTEDTVRKATVVFTFNMTFAVGAAFLICAIESLPMNDVLFETFSAMNTVGITRNLTRELSNVSRIVIMLLMYLGRVGSLTFAFSFIRKKNTDLLKSPIAEISVG